MYGSGELTNDIRNMHLSKKPYSERCNFLIQHGSGSFELPISSESSVMDLHQAVLTLTNPRWPRESACPLATVSYA